MWFENYNASDTPDSKHPVPSKGHYSVATAAAPAGPFTMLHDCM